MDKVFSKFRNKVRNQPARDRQALVVIVGAAILFVIFTLFYDNYIRVERQVAVSAYAGVISTSLWQFEPKAPTDYLTLIVAEQGYERFQVLTDDGFSFIDVQNKQHDWFTNLLITIGLIQRVETTADITYRYETIGKIKAIWLNTNIYVYFYALIVLILLIGVYWLYSRILHSKHELELRVQERTTELHDANIELGESEARYRSIFEFSPISLREEDFSGVKKIVDHLRDAGVKDFRSYFEQHPETIAECVRAVRVLYVNQNTLELFKTDHKERLYQGLTDIFTRESLTSFGQQVAAFAQGETYFDCETIQQTVTGEKLWAGTRVSIAPGYEETWEKVFVSILDITHRKETEVELANYREHLEELIASRTKELIALQHDLEQRVAERTEELAQVNTGLSAEIIERKRLEEKVHLYTEELEQRVADRTHELSVLYDVTAVASNVLDLDELLSRLLEQSLSAMRRKAGTIHLFDELASTPRLSNEQNVPRSISDGLVAFIANQGEARERLESHSPLIIADLERDIRIPENIRESGWQSYIGMPIQDTRGQLLGILSIFGKTEDQLTTEELTLLSAIADHIGLAVENVRLRHQAEKTAVLEDRQRLARELHDAVSQSLFSASVIAETLPRLWERKPQVVQQNLGDLHRLIRGALAEMRMLLLELRPMSMENAVLGELLQQLVDGMKGRTQLNVTLQINGQGNLPTQVKENLFRITQEALNNVVKHARAKNVVLILNQSEDQISLSICDDGQGFDVKNLDGGHLGLQIMRERAENIGASLTISSSPGQGTAVVAVWTRTDKQSKRPLNI